MADGFDPGGFDPGGFYEGGDGPTGPTFELAEFGFRGHLHAESWSQGVFGFVGEVVGGPVAPSFISHVFGWTGSVTATVRDASVSGATSGTFGFLGCVKGSTGPVLPATDWQWSEADVDPEVLETLRVRLRTPDGEFTTIDPADLADLEITMTRKGGVDTMTLSIRRDSRLDLGDLDYGTECEVEYLGRTWQAWLSEASLDHGATMTRKVSLLGWIARLREDDDSFRRVYAERKLSAWQTDQGHVVGDNLNQFTVSSDANEILMAANWGAKFQIGDEDWGTLETPGSACRIYYELFGGVPTNERIRVLHLKVMVGGAHSGHEWCG
jgi:hypothetical protein